MAFHSLSPRLRSVSPVWPVLLATMIADAVLMARGGFSLDWRNSWLMLLLMLLPAAGALFYRYVRPDARIYLLLVSLAQLMLFTAAGVVLSYLAAGFSLPLIDRQLIAFDHRLGFNWQAHMAWLSVHPWLDKPLQIAYASFVPQILATTLLLSLLSRHAELTRFMVGYMLAAIISIALSGLLPSVGTYLFYDVNPAALIIHPMAPRLHEEHLLGLRNGSLRALPIGGAKGIITFPSFHAAGGVLLAYTARVQRVWFALSLLLNAALVFSVFSQGGHYLTDALGGIAVAVAAIALARLIAPRG